MQKPYLPLRFLFGTVMLLLIPGFVCSQYEVVEIPDSHDLEVRFSGKAVDTIPLLQGSGFINVDYFLSGDKLYTLRLSRYEMGRRKNKHWYRFHWIQLSPEGHQIVEEEELMFSCKAGRKYSTDLGLESMEMVARCGKGWRLRYKIEMDMVGYEKGDFRRFIREVRKLARKRVRFPTVMPNYIDHI